MKEVIVFIVALISVIIFASNNLTSNISTILVPAVAPKVP